MPPEHCFVLEYYKRDGLQLGPVAVEPDFQPARESAWLAGVRRGLLEPLTCPATGTVEPVWSEQRGSPYCDGIRVLPEGGEADPAAFVLPTSYFRDLANQHAGTWLEKGALEPGESFLYQVCAYPLPTERNRDRPRSDGLHVEPIAEPIALANSSLDVFFARAQPFGEQHSDDVAVFIAQRVLDETCALAEAAGEIESGAVLVGRLHRDSSRPDVFIEVTALIPAQHALATGASFAFTPETWAAADAAIGLRDQSEIICGWMHSHPRFCRACPPERQQHCSLAKPFFSADDIHLHRTCFGHSHQLALLVSDLPEGGQTPALFGWRNGMVVPRGFHALKAPT